MVLQKEKVIKHFGSLTSISKRLTEILAEIHFIQFSFSNGKTI